MLTPTEQMPEHCLSIHAEHCLSIMLEQCLARATNVTYVLTYKPLNLSSYLTLGNARETRHNFGDLWTKTRRRACAARGQAVTR